MQGGDDVGDEVGQCLLFRYDYFLHGRECLDWSWKHSIYDGGEPLEKSYHSSLLLPLSLYGFFASAVPGTPSNSTPPKSRGIQYPTHCTIER